MARTQDRRVFAHTILEIIADAIAILRQDASEYAFIGLVGGAAGGIAVLVLGIIGGPIAVALIAPLLLLIAISTLATSSAALGIGRNQLQPDASRAFLQVGLRSIAVVRPWLPLVVVLGAASYAAAAFSEDLGPVPPEAIMLALAVVGAAYALPRSLCFTALFEYDLSARDAVSTSAALMRTTTGPVATAWCIVLAPAILVAALGAIGGIDLVTGAVISVLFVVAMPAGAVFMSLLFREAASAAQASLAS